MGKVYTVIDEDLQAWIERQQMFFVATAPLAADGLLNVSPKGHDTLRVIDQHTLAYLDYGGSGIETVAHLRENGRIVIMLCAFEGPPKIYRFYGTGKVFSPLDKGFDDLALHFDRSQLGTRTIVRIAVSRIADSCGFGVPLYDFRQQRTTSVEYVRKREAATIGSYLVEKNAQSIDGLGGLSEAEAMAFESPSEPEP